MYTDTKFPPQQADLKAGPGMILSNGILQIKPEQIVGFKNFNFPSFVFCNSARKILYIFKTINPGVTYIDIDIDHFDSVPLSDPFLPSSNTTVLTQWQNEHIAAMFSAESSPPSDLRVPL
jgi:hypothetical protein